MDYKDYYQILGISKTATADEIRKVFRKLAIKYHPDKNPGNKAAEEKFKEVNEANEVLSDPEKRRKYDALGENWQNFRQQGGRSKEYDWNQWSGQKGSRYSQEDIFDNEGNFSDFFESIFGSTGSQRGKTHNRKHKGEEVAADMEVTLEEAFLGGDRMIMLNGKKINLKLKPGLRDGQVLRMKGKGEPGRNGGEPGDLLITINIVPHDRFKRQGNDLSGDHFIDLYTAVLGGKTNLRTLDKTIAVTIPAGTDSGRVFRLTGAGMPIFEDPIKRGDLLIRIMIRVPNSLSEKEKELFNQLSELHNKGVHS